MFMYDMFLADKKMTDANLPRSVRDDIEGFSRLLEMMHTVPDHFVESLLPHNIERLNECEKIMYTQLRNIVPHLRAAASSIREVVRQSILPNVRKHRVIKEKTGQHTVRRGQVETETLTTEVLEKGRVKKVTHNIQRIRCLDCKKTFISPYNFTHHNCYPEKKVPKQVPGRICPRCRNPDLNLASNAAYDSHLEKCEGFGTTTSNRGRKGMPFIARPCWKCHDPHIYTDSACYAEHLMNCAVPSSTSRDDQENPAITQVSDVKSQKNNKKVPCQYCGKEMLPQNLKQHNCKKKSKAVYKCPVFCDRQMNPPNLARHLNANNRVCGKLAHNFKCPKCELQCENADCMVKHILNCIYGTSENEPLQTDAQQSTAEKGNTSHQSKGSQSNAKDVKTATAAHDASSQQQKISTHMCNKCMYPFNSDINLEQHIKKIHRNDDDGEGCSGCGQKFVDARTQAKHNNKCRAPRACRYCWELFDREHDLVSHALLCNYQKKCMSCLTTSQSKRELKVHIKCAHQWAWAKYACGSCGFMCERKQALREHAIICSKMESSSPTHSRDTTTPSNATSARGKIPSILLVQPSRDGSELFNWKEATKIIKSIKDYKTLRSYVLSLDLPPLKIKWSPNQLPKDRYDTISNKLKPKNVSPDMVALWVKDDGNCFMRVMARYLLGDPEQHPEIRIRMAKEAAKNEHLYLDHNYMFAGLNPSDKIISLPEYYAGITGTCKVENITNLNTETIRHIFRKELVKWSKARAWIAMWQLHVASNMCGHPLNVVHVVDKCRHSMWEYYNREVHPVMNTDRPQLLHIMWTTANEEHRTPVTINDINHFVPLVWKSQTENS